MLSIIVSVWNEEAGLLAFHAELTRSLEQIEQPAEIIYVNDGSTDASDAVLSRLSGEDGRVVVVTLSRNFGHEIAMQAGIDHSRGEYLFLLDADLQHPPALLPEIHRKLAAGDDIVFCIRDGYATSWWRRLCAAVFYKTINVVTNTEMIPNSSDFFAINRKVAEFVKQMRERDRFLRGLLRWSGFRQGTLTYNQGVRSAGASKYSFLTLLELALNAAISFSGNPLRKFALVGLAVAGGAFAYTLYIVVLFLFFPQVLLPGWATIVVSILFIGGLTIFMLSVIGEYLARIYAEIKRRPLYLVREVQTKPASRPGDDALNSAPPHVQSLR